MWFHSFHFCRVILSTRHYLYIFFKFLLFKYSFTYKQWQKKSYIDRSVVMQGYTIFFFSCMCKLNSIELATASVNAM